LKLTRSTDANVRTGVAASLAGACASVSKSSEADGLHADVRTGPILIVRAKVVSGVTVMSTS
jgi:hypothetical protein